MAGNRFAMMSEWMKNGNINEFVTAHRDTNRFELVSSPLKPRISSIAVDNYVISPVVGRGSEGLDLHARAGNDPRGSQRGATSKARTTRTLSLIGFIYQGQYPYRSRRPRLPGGLRSTQNRVGRLEHYLLELISTRRHVSMDESRAPRPGEVRSQRQPSDQTLGLLRSWNGNIRGPEQASTVLQV